MSLSKVKVSYSYLQHYRLFIKADHQGWLKGMNMISNNAADDPGLDDANASSLHTAVACNAFVYDISYFRNDYKPIVTATPAPYTSL